MSDTVDKPASPPGSQSASALPIHRKLATILSADVAEFSRLMSEDEEQTLRVFRGHKKIFEALVANHNGRVFNTAGDAILAEFASAVEAVRCATDVQAALRTRNDKFPPNRQVRFRIGVNLGDVMIQGQDLLGDGVNLAARLQTAAEPGGVCISGSVHDQIRNKLSLTFQSLGERSYKNIPQPVRTFAIAESEAGAVLPAPKPESTSKKKAVIGAVVAIVVVAGVAYGAFTLHERGKAENAPAASAANQNASVSTAPAPTPVPAAATPVAAQPSATSPTAAVPAPASPKADATPAPARQTPPKSPAAATTTATNGASAAAAKHPRAGAHAGKFDGTYSGQVCYGKTPKLPNRCYEAEGTVAGGKLTGSWPFKGKEGDLNVTLSGDVTPSGDVTLTMQSERADRTHVGTIRMNGTIRDGALIASGAFERGRPANLDWRIKP